MADVLLVSAREDYAFADGVAASLEQSGLSVAQTDGYTRDGENAPCVLVLWSVTSGRSAAIRNVAVRAQHEGRLIAGCLAGGEPPLGFSRPRPFDLSNWDGDPNASALDPMFFAVDRLVCAARLNRGQPDEPRTVTPIRQPLTPRAPIAPQMPPTAAPAPRVTPIRAMRTTASAPQPAPHRQPQPAPAPASPLVAEAAAWKRIEHSEDPAEFLNYLHEYGPDGLFAELAQMRLDKLQAKPQPKSAFIPHNPSPHLERPRPAERPRQAAPLSVRPRPVAPPPMELEEAPAWREAPQAPRMERMEAPRPPMRAQTRRRPPPDMAQPQVHLPPPPIQRSSFRLAPVLLIAVLAAMAAAVFHFTRQAPPQSSANNEIAAAPVVDAPMDSNNGYAVATPLDQQTAIPAAARVQTPTARRAPTPPAQPRQQRPPSSQQETAAYVPPPPPAITFSPPAEQPAPPAPQAAAMAPPPAPTPAPAPAPAPKAAANPYISPVWTRKPTGTALLSAYPSAAAERGISGQVVLDCGIFGTGALACTVASESPGKMGFGRAALSVANGFRAAPTTASGEPTAGKRVRVPIAFKSQ